MSDGDTHIPSRPSRSDGVPRVPTVTSTADRLFLPAVVVALVPIVVATGRAARQGWTPIGDNAYFLVRARDVFTEHHPLLGTWTSASRSTDTNFNNPGPLFFDVLALPAKLGGAIGLAIGVALLNGAAVVGIALMVRRRAGTLAALAAIAVTAVLGHSMGSQLLFDPWQPNALLLTFLFCLTCVWSVATGDAVAAPWAAASASLIVQTHLSYAVLLAVGGAWAVVGLVLSARRQRIDHPDAWPAARRSLRRAALATALVVAVCWAQPIAENLTSPGQGNLQRLAGNASGTEEVTGVELGTAIVADTLVVPPAWLRPSFGDSLRRADPDTTRPTSIDVPIAVGVVALTLLGGALASIAWTWRRREWVIAGSSWTALLTVGAGLLTSWQLPFGSLGIAAHQFRWLWPLGAFATMVLLVAALRRWAVTPRAQRLAAVALALAILVSAGLNLPTYNARSGPSADEYAIEVMRRARPQMDALEGRGPLLIDFSDVRFGEPYTGPVMAELQRRGIPFVVSDETLVRQLGESRRIDGAATRLIFRDGVQVGFPPPDAERVVHVAGLGADDQRRLDDLEAEIARHLASVGLRTRDLSATDISEPYRDAIEALPAADAVDTILRFRVLLALLEADLVVVPDAWRDRFARYAELQRRADQGSLALYVAPLEP